MLQGFDLSWQPEIPRYEGAALYQHDFERLDLVSGRERHAWSTWQFLFGLWLRMSGSALGANVAAAVEHRAGHHGSAGAVRLRCSSEDLHSK